MLKSSSAILCITAILLTGCSNSQPAPTTITKTVTAVPQTTTSEPTPTNTAPTTTQSTPIQEPPQTIIQQTTIYQAPPAPTNTGVTGFTGAPNGEPQQLNKTIAYCMNDPSYQPGTTMFTDGTTGWTTNCAGM